MYVTAHATQRAKERLNIANAKRLRDEALTAMLFGKRKNNTFIYKGIVFVFTSKLDALKTVYAL